MAGRRPRGTRPIAWPSGCWPRGATWPECSGAGCRELRARCRERLARGHPLANLAVDRGVVEQLEVIGAPDVAVMLDRKAQPLPFLVVPGARLQHEQIAHDPACQSVRLA